MCSDCSSKSALPDLRPCRLLRQLAQPSCNQALSQDPPSDHRGLRSAEEKLRDSERHEDRHHILTVAVTFLHVAIAIATIAIIVRGQRWPWYAALALGAIGTMGAAYAYIG
jgi:Domain of unknown function (DUF4337)